VKCLHAHYAYHLAGGEDPVGAWVAERLREGPPIHYEKPARRVAAVDLARTPSGFWWRDSPMAGRPGRAGPGHDHHAIGQGVDRTARLSPEALRRTLHVLERYCRGPGLSMPNGSICAPPARCGTHPTVEQLAAAVERLTGEPMEVLTGQEEALLSFLGATRAWTLRPLPGCGHRRGSTEFVVGDGRPPEALSTRMGSVRLTERFIQTDPPSDEDLDTVEQAIGHVLAKVEERLPVRDARTLVAVAGTSTTVQAIAMGLPEYDPEVLHRSCSHGPTPGGCSGSCAT